MAALEAEARAPQADTAYFGIVFGIEAGRKGLLEAYQPPHFDEIPANLKAPDGQWFTIHQGSIAFIVNTAELRGLPIPQSWNDLLDPKYAGKVGFLDPTQAAVGTPYMLQEIWPWEERWTTGILELHISRNSMPMV